jgi:hypothetical protein
MATNFPSNLDAFTNPTSGDTLDSPDHAGQHADVNDAVEALQAKVGVDSSAVTTSLDYKIAGLESVASLGYKFLGRDYFTSSGTYSLGHIVGADVVANTKVVRAIVIGGGGGAGNLPNGSSSLWSVSVPGNGGCIAVLGKEVDAGFLSGSLDIVVGSGGAGAPSSGGYGSSGTPSRITFNYDSSFLQASGGFGNNGYTTSGSVIINNSSSQSTSTSGTWLSGYILKVSSTGLIAAPSVATRGSGNSLVFRRTFARFYDRPANFLDPYVPIEFFTQDIMQILGGISSPVTGGNETGIGGGGSGYVWHNFFFGPWNGGSGQAGAVFLEYYG